MAEYFPFAAYWWAYGSFTLLVLVLLAVDLGVFHRRPHAISMREAAGWSATWVVLALVFNYAFYRYASAQFGPEIGTRLALEFLTGYVVEKALSVDNIFVFALIFAYFGIPARYQHRVLFFGILGALVFRAVFIALGALLLQYTIIVLVFGAFLIFTGVKMLLMKERPFMPEGSLAIRLLRRVVPVTPQLQEQRFFVRENGRWHATLLFVTLLFIEMSDVLFAIDSVPAIFAITREPLIVFTSNVFAILGLRAMYFLLAGALERFYLLKHGLAVVLIFVGLKMVWLNEVFGGKFPIAWSLGFILATLAVAVVASLLIPPTGRSRPSEGPAT